MTPMNRSRLQAVQDQHISQRLAYRTDMKEGDQAFFNPDRSYAVRELLWSVLLAAIAGIVSFVGLATFVAFIGSPESDSNYGQSAEIGVVQSNGLDGLLGQLLLISAVSIIVWVVVFVLLMLLPERQWASQWEILIDGEADRASAVASSIERQIAGRATPIMVDFQGPRMFGNLRGVEGYLVTLDLHPLPGPYDGRYGAYVGVYAFGNDLFVTWTMWRAMRRSKVIRTLLDLSEPLDQIVRTDPARAMRDSIHNSVRQAIDDGILGNVIPEPTRAAPRSDAIRQEPHDGVDDD